jgi:predicted ATP-grasp superfamily ATP-dependent carboligase
VRHSAKPGAVVLGGDLRALGIVRSLGRRDIPVTVVRSDEDLVAMASRYATHRVVQEPKSEESAQLQDLMTLIERFDLGGSVLYATGDESSAFLSRHRDLLASCVQVTTPPWDVLRLVYDKRTTHHIAQCCGVGVPRTVFPRDLTELRELDMSFPVILKPSVKRHENALTRARAWRADDLRQLTDLYREARTLEDADTLMVQELLVGDGRSRFSYAALCHEGEPLASLTACRLRQYPIEFGRHSTYVITVDDEDIESAGRRFLRAVRYSGIVELEFHRDVRDGELKLLDVNHRAWGWHSLGAAAGVDFPYLEWLTNTGREISAVRGRPGVRWRRASTDLLAILSELRRGKTSLRQSFSAFRPGANRAVWAKDDPLPAIADPPLTLRKRVSRYKREAKA